MIGLALIALGFVLIAAGLTVRLSIAAINAHTTATIEGALRAQSRAAGLDANLKAGWRG